MHLVRSSDHTTITFSTMPSTQHPPIKIHSHSSRSTTVCSAACSALVWAITEADVTLGADAPVPMAARVAATIASADDADVVAAGVAGVVGDVVAIVVAVVVLLLVNIRMSATSDDAVRLPLSEALDIASIG